MKTTWKQYQQLYEKIETAERYAVKLGQEQLAKKLDGILKESFDCAIKDYPEMKL